MMSGQTHQSHEDLFEAYYFEFMSSSESKAFEKQLAQDSSLRQQFEQWLEALNDVHEWTGGDAPGIDRVESLAIPRLPQRKSIFGWLRLSPVRLAWQAAILIAVFAVGFLAGQKTEVNEPSSQPSITIPSAGKDTPEPPSTPDQTIHLVNHTDGDGADDLPKRITTEEDGKLIIETTLSDSGTRAVWVVDGNFKLRS